MNLKCIVCGADVEYRDDPLMVRPYWYNYPSCTDCKLKYPPALIKACGDKYTYTAKLRNSKPMETIDFTSAKINGDWVTLLNPDSFFTLEGVTCPRGVDVNINDIEWVADATG